MKEPKIRFNEFKGEWKEKELNSHASYICSGKNTNMQGPYPLYGSTGIIGTTDKPYHTGPMLLVARVGANAGYLQLIEEECGVSDNTLIIQPNNELPEKYLFYYFDHFNLNRFIYGSGQPLITGGMLKKMPVRFGCTTETRKLASFFTTLDAQISASTSRLASLKQIKAASLQAMFPQEGETVPKLRFKGFEGEWEKVKLGDIAELYRGLTYSPNNISTTGVRVLRSSNIADGQFVISKNDVFVEDTCINIILAQKGDILITAANGSPRLVGKHAIITNDENGPLVAGGFMLLARSKESTFINASMGSSWYFKFLKSGVSGGNGSIGNLNKSDLEQVSMPYPKEKRERDAIASFFTNLDRQITLQSQRLEKLKQIKAACLDKMFV